MQCIEPCCKTMTDLQRQRSGLQTFLQGINESLEKPSITDCYSIRDHHPHMYSTYYANVLRK